MPAKRRYPAPPGLKAVRRRLATGASVIYWYHRATGARLQHDPATEAGLAEVGRLNSRAAALGEVQTFAAGTLAALWRAYADSPQWRALRPRTRSDYQAVRDWLGPAAEKAVVRAITRAQVQKLQDKAAGERGRRFANYVLQVLRLLLEWGRGRGWIDVNPAMGMKQIRKPAGEASLNRAWTAGEVEAFLTEADFHVALPFALAVFAGMRQGDALGVTWSAYDGARLRWRARKNGQLCEAPVTGTFKAMLDAARERRGDAVTIAATLAGTPWTSSGYRAVFFRLVRQLTAAGQLAEGCTFHGARHTIGTLARQAQETDWRVSAAIGDRSTHMAGIYGRDADRATAQTEVLQGVQGRFANIDWKTPRS